jgi:hypothetical protein
MKTEGSLPQSKQTATYPYPEPDKSCPWLLSRILKVHFKITPIYAWVFPVVSFPQVSPYALHASPITVYT